MRKLLERPDIFRHFVLEILFLGAIILVYCITEPTTIIPLIIGIPLCLIIMYINNFVLPIAPKVEKYKKVKGPTFR